MGQPRFVKDYDRFRDNPVPARNCYFIVVMPDLIRHPVTLNPWIPWSSQGMTDFVKLVQVYCDTVSKPGNDNLRLSQQSAGVCIIELFMVKKGRDRYIMKLIYDHGRRG